MLQWYLSASVGQCFSRLDRLTPTCVRIPASERAPWRFSGAAASAITRLKSMDHICTAKVVEQGSVAFSGRLAIWAPASPLAALVSAALAVRGAAPMGCWHRLLIRQGVEGIHGSHELHEFLQRSHGTERLLERTGFTDRRNPAEWGTRKCTSHTGTTIIRAGTVANNARNTGSVDARDTESIIAAGDMTKSQTC